MAGGDSTIKNKIVIEGEGAYRKALAEINRALRESKSEMKAAAAEYAASGENMAALNEQGDALERMLQEQAQALELMHAQLKKVEAAYGENSREAVELRTKINNMRAETAKTQGELNTLRDRLDAVGDAGEDLERDLMGSSNGIAGVGEQAAAAQAEVNELSQSIAEAMGQKTLEFIVGGVGLKMLQDGLKQAVTWGIGEGVQNITDRNHTMAMTNTDAETSEMLARVGDAVKRQFSAYITDEQAMGLMANLWTGMGIGGHIPTEEEMTRLAPQIFGVSQAKGIGTTEIIDNAQTLVTEFNESWQRSIDLIDALGAATVGHTQEAMSAMGTYSEVFKQAGYDADDMFGIMIRGAQEFGVEKLGDLGKNLATFEKNLTSGSAGVKEALESLGIEATDLPLKFQEGGETAAQAMKLILTALLSVEDSAKQADIAKALFGDMNWVKNGEDIARLFLEGFDNEMDVEGQAQRTAQAWSDTLENNWSGAVERFGQKAGDLTQPMLEGLNESIKTFNESWDSGGGLFDSFLNAYANWGDQLKEHFYGPIGDAISGAIESADTALGDGLGSISEKFFKGAGEETDTTAADAAAGRWVDALRGGVDAKAAEETPSTAIQNMLDNMMPTLEILEERAKAYAENHKAGIIAQLETVYGVDANDEDFQAWQTFQQAMIDSAYEDSVQRAGKLGEDSAQASVDGVESKEPDMGWAGDALGRSGVDGTRSGLDGMYGAGADGASGAVSGLRTGIDGAYAAGAAMGKAFERGYKASLDQHSPSRIMFAAAKDTDQGLLNAYEEDEALVRQAAAGIGLAVQEGYTQTAGAAIRLDDAAPADALGPELVAMIANAVREGISGLAFSFNAQTFAALTEQYASRETSARAMRTVAGQSSSRRGW